MIRSLVFTCLLDVSPAFGAMTTTEGGKVITACVAAWEAAPDSEKGDVHLFVSRWVGSVGSDWNA